MEIIEKNFFKKNEVAVLILNFVFICIYVSSSLLNSDILKMKKIILIFIFLSCFIFSLKKFKNNLIIPLYLLSLFTFQWGRIVFLYLFFDLEAKMTWFSNEILSEATLNYMYDLLFFNIIGITIGVFFYKRRKKIKIKTSCSKKVVLLILILTFPFLLKVSIGIAQESIQIGYLNTYLIERSNLNKSSSLIKFLSNICYYGIFLALAINPFKDKKTKIVIFIYLVVLFLQAFRGQRGPLISGVFFIIWYISNYKIYKIDYKKILFILSLLIFLSQNFNSFRNKDEYRETNVEKLKNFIFYQGVTGTFLSLTNNQKEFFDEKRIPFIFSSLIGMKIKSQSEEIATKIKKSKNVPLSHKMSVELNKEMYVQGMGVGGNYILEMYELGGKYGVLILSIIHTLALIWISENIYRMNLFIRSFMYLAMSDFFLIPRNEYFISFPLEVILKMTFSFLIIIFLEKFIKNISLEK